MATKTKRLDDLKAAIALPSDDGKIREIEICCDGELKEFWRWDEKTQRYIMEILGHGEGENEKAA